MKLEEKKLLAPEIHNINSKEHALEVLRSLKKQGVHVQYKYKRVMIPHQTKDKFFVKCEGKIMLGYYGGVEYGGMGRGTAKTVGENISRELCIDSGESFDKIWKTL